MTTDTTFEVVMPAMGDSVSEGTVVEWRKREGEPVAADEPIVVISTDKVDAEVPAPAAGVLARIRTAEGETVQVGTVLAEITTGSGAGGNGSAPTGGSAREEASRRVDESAQGDGSASTGSVPASSAQDDGSPPDEGNDPPQNAAYVDITMPAMGESVGEGVILEWTKQPGDTVQADETIVEVSTDKVDAEVPAPAAGVLSEILAQPGETVTVGQVIGRLGQQAASGTGRSADQGSNGDAAPTPRVSGTHAAEPGAGIPPDTESGNGGSDDDHADASPVARRVAAALGVDLEEIHGTGPHGRIFKEDVLAVAASREAGGDSRADDGNRGDGDNRGDDGDRGEGAPQRQASRRTVTALKGGAAMLAHYMELSRSIPTATSMRTLAVTALDSRRRELKQAGHRISFTQLIAYATARAIADQVPVMARHYEEIEGKPHVVDDGEVNLGIAVDVERPDGTRTLMVPVIRDAGRLSFGDFLAAFDDLVDRARDNQLQADDLQGANVSLTNPGGLGTVASVPRLMNGQGTILATGAIGYPPGLATIGEQIGAEKVMTITSTYDHRIIQGAESGRFLAALEALLAGEDGFYEDVFGALGVSGGAPRATASATRGVSAAHAASAEISAPAASHESATAAASAPIAASAAQAAPGAPSTSTTSGVDLELLQAVQAATSLLKAHRMHGHLAAKLHPLGSEPEGDPALDPDTVGLTPELMQRIPASVLRTHVQGKTLADALPELRETYCGTIAYEIEHISSHRQRTWLREKIEAGSFRQPLSDTEARLLLRRLTRVESLERFLHKAYLGQKQFSIEGLDMTVPMIDEVIRLAARSGGREVVIGMAHRGRLNVLAHNLRRRYETIFREFEGASKIEAVTTLPQGGTGDVKYHHGAKGSWTLDDGTTVVVRLESNPSHLEFVSPVINGATRALQTTHEERHTRLASHVAIPVVLHGDAAFPAQGVVAETLNLQALDGYTVGGTVHLIQNNQIGFTTDPDDARSTRWASDLAKGFDVPIIHVNADDPQACIAAVRLAFAYRQEFGHDVLIDLIGYRRWGHNEADEPAYTQPRMARVIKEKKTVRELFAAELVARGLITQEEADAEAKEIWSGMAEHHRALKEELAHSRAEAPTGGYQIDRTPSPQVTTAVTADCLRALNDELLRIPEGFTVHPKLSKQLEKRHETLGPDGGIDWAHAEALAFASLLAEGTPIRFTGQDVERGTFSQRHLVLHDAETGDRVAPIQSLPSARAPMELHNSPLSETACLGFEYGYAIEAPDSLVLWEAQFGDFANGAQVIIDQFIVSGLVKWGVTSRLTMLLPHGYEGSGPEHSSARLERFLQLAAEGNIRVANLTTPAQYFHLLRRQAKIAKQRPLVVMTPKSLLRLPQATSRIEHLSDGQFFPVLPEPRIDEEKVSRLILCSGKIYYDLKNHATRENNEGVAISRVELLYPFPQDQIEAELARYPNLREVAWVQEEPRNMGARAHMSPRLLQILPPSLSFGYVGRPERASTGEGYPAAHTAEQTRIIRTALDLSVPVSVNPAKPPGER